MTTKLPDGIHELLAERVDSFEKLELIVTLCAAPRSTMGMDDLSRSLNLSREVVRDAAFALREASLVELTARGEVRLLPLTSRDHAVVIDLVHLYNEDRFTVVKAMGEIAMHRIRTMASRTFGEALVVRGKPPKDGGDE